MRLCDCAIAKYFIWISFQGHQAHIKDNKSDDGFLLIDFDSVSQIFKIMDIFRKFGRFSGLEVNYDKADLCCVNFSFSNNEMAQLLNFGFREDKILTENHCKPFCDTVSNQAIC